MTPLPTLFALSAFLAAQTPTPHPDLLAPGIWLIRGQVIPNRQPDGNTIVFKGPDGLVVMDTGRHPWHRRAILDLADSLHVPIVAIINSHWHLDHVSGNPDLKRAFPGATVYASDAIDGALTGFLARSAADSRKYLESGTLPPETLEDLKGDLATFDSGQLLRPDVVIRNSATRNLGGHSLVLNLAPDAATAGDIWVFDPASSFVAVGDLVTLPAAYLDTGCPPGWKAALDSVLATPFTTAIPGHGRPLTRAELQSYRNAFAALVDCSASDQTAAQCAAAWTDTIAPLVGNEERQLQRAREMTEYYVARVLRPNGGKSASCKEG